MTKSTIQPQHTTAESLVVSGPAQIGEPSTKSPNNIQNSRTTLDNNNNKKVVTSDDETAMKGESTNNNRLTISVQNDEDEGQQNPSATSSTAVVEVNVLSNNNNNTTTPPAPAGEKEDDEQEGVLVDVPPVVVAASCISFTLKFALGQLLAFTVSITGVFTTLLVEDNSSISTIQCITSYGFIVVVTALVYFPLIVWRRVVVDAAYKRLPPTTANGDDSATTTTPAPTTNNTTPSATLQPHSSSSSTGRELSYNNNEGSNNNGVQQLDDDAEEEEGVESANITTTTVIIKSYRGVGCQVWRFAGIAVVDVAANFTVVMAYAYTDMTSVQLLDCSSILWVMGLSYLLLKNVRYKLLWHIVGALLSVVGLVLLIVMDADGMSRSDGGKRTKGDVILGDILCLVSALFYALSNVLSERVVRDSCGINGVQTAPTTTTTTTTTIATSENEQPSIITTTNTANADDTEAGSIFTNRQPTHHHNSNDQTTTTHHTPSPSHRSCKESTPLLLNRICPDRDDVDDDEARISLKGRRGGEEGDGSSGNYSWLLPSSHSPPPPLKFVVIVEYLFWMALSGLILSTLLFFILQDYTKFASYNEYHSSINSEDLNNSNNPLSITGGDHHHHHIADAISTTTDIHHHHHHVSSSAHHYQHHHLNQNRGNSSNSSSPPFSPGYAYQREYDGTALVDVSYTIGYGLSMVTVYTLMPVLFIVASATFANLSLLTADIYSVIWNVAVFGIYPKYSFLASFVIIVFGVVVFDTNGFLEIRKALQKRRAHCRSKQHVIRGANS